MLDHIDAHLDDELTVAKLGGMTVYGTVQPRRLKRTSYQLAFRRASPIVDIALACGYEGPEARAFSTGIGQSPSDFRRQPQWSTWHATYQPSNQLRAHHMKSVQAARQVDIVHVNDIDIAVLEHRGDPNLLGDSVRSFIEWRNAHGQPPKLSATFNILYDNPAEVAPEDYRFDICASIDRAVTGNGFGVVEKTIPGGRCAVLRHVGSDDTLAESIRYLVFQWLPRSDEARRDFPTYLQRVTFFPDVPENEAVTDVFLPLR